MIPPGLVTYSDGEIEQLARMELRRRPDVDFRAPINLEVLVENEEDVEMEVMYGLVYRHKVEGCVCKRYMSNKLVVGVDQTILAGPWHGYNAVLGEEYAHIRLHPALFLYVETVEDFIKLQSDPEWRRFERDARKFSAAIRMPPELLSLEAEQLYVRTIREEGFVDPNTIEKSIRNRLADSFRVNPDEMQRRICSWPCDLRSRIVASVQSQSLILVPESWALKAVPPSHLRTKNGLLDREPSP